ncbi:hypothetical protein [Pollutibacter soli]|uniref:hypothetical protein n=1 Tax=Pollutibacter soli TaxID=3034157 RepID=UPI0030141A34
MKSIWAVLFSLLVFSCSSKVKEQKFTQKDAAFYPIEAFIKDELRKVDSLPIAVFAVRSLNGKNDTSIVEKSVLHAKAVDLITPDISKEPLKEKYTESVFMDATINSVTMSYATEDENAEIKKIDVFVDPETEKVKYIYVEKLTSSGDTTALRKMIWTAGKYLQISTSLSIKNGGDSIVQEKYSWDFMN